MALGKEPDAELEGRLPRPARAEGRCRLSRSCWSSTTTTRTERSPRRTSCRQCGWSRATSSGGRSARIPTNSLNKTFATFGRALKKDRYLESIQAHFLLLPSYRRFPADEEFQRELQARDLYNFRSRSYWLRRLENHGRKERVPVDEYTIEHILPQNENLSAQWQADLGPEWERIQKTWLHTLGNLTLTGYNSEYSDRPFAEKRDMKGGFKESPLRLNEGLGEPGPLERGRDPGRGRRSSPAWRSSVWAAPSLPADVLDAYKPKAATAAATPSTITRTWLTGRCASSSRRSARRCWRSTRA